MVNHPNRSQWLKSADGALCLDGYPIRIRQNAGDKPPFTLECDGRAPMAYWTLKSAQQDAKRLRDELDAFAD